MMRKAEYKWTCDGKCRICPYPGALCKEKITIEPEHISHKRDDNVIYMDEAVRREVTKHMGG